MSAKKKVTNKDVVTKKPREKGQRYQSQKSKILILLQERNDLTCSKLAEILGIPVERVNTVLSSLRRSGFKIFPSKGPNTPLRIAVNQKDGMRFINYRRRLFLPTAVRMIVAEHELGEQFKELADRPKNLLLELNNATKQNGTQIRDGSSK